MKRFVFAVMTAAVVVDMGYSQSNSNVTIPVNKTTAASGKQMFTNYCAPCHGMNGKGHGPVASSLKSPPADLTMLSKNNNGQFPDNHIAAVLRLGTKIPSHGTPEMPIWGPILGKLDQPNPENQQLRISNLTRYLKTIQVK